MDYEKQLDALNSLITINNDRIEGYENASEVTDEQRFKKPCLRNLFPLVRNVSKNWLGK